MAKMETLRERANILRTLESPVIRADLFVLAKRCEALASEAERESTEREPQRMSG